MIHYLKIHDYLRYTSNVRKCFEKDLFTIVVARSTESYFPLHFFLKDINQHKNLPLLRLSAGVIIRGRITPRFSKLNKGADNQNDHEILLSAPLIYQGQRTGY